VLTSESTEEETPQGAPSRDFTGAILIAEELYGSVLRAQQA